MSIELLTREHMLSFKNALKCVNKSIKIISPFIGLSTSKIIAQFMKENPKCECIIITRFYRQDFLEGVSSLDALKILKESNVTLYGLKDLHSKLYLVDDNFGIIGSANFTIGGFKSNHELSLAIEDEYELLKNLNDYFEELIQSIKCSGSWEITLNKIREEFELTDNIFKNRKDRLVKFTNNKKWGADISKLRKDIDQKEIDLVEQFLKKELEESNEIAWIKFEGTGENRWDNNYKYFPKKLKSKGVYTNHFPRKPRSIERGARIYLSVLSYDEKGNAIPIIIGRAKSYGYLETNVTDDVDRIGNVLLERYPYYVELYDIEIIDTEIVNGISLNTVIMELGTNLYPNTIGRNLKQEDIRKRHHQKSHIRITSVAKSFLDDKLDSLIKEYGIINVD
ncbi:phospholipase D-like domain-containing protein [Romboutsia lituseburensis]|uniref:phospholipase D-like domain-containing protein n=1 Tax=Romboutsia lituseburensis TaxID=1537 RepID=UPI00215A3379|nr:phospholipase D-like domain-containing protein [Romboutsia lituseburensis]MCR8744279.1 phospholipase D-like domain-containing protein [Romboutsia lituseburensis]